MAEAKDAVAAAKEARAAKDAAATANDAAAAKEATAAKEEIAATKEASAAKVEAAEANEEEADGQQLVCQDFEKKKHIFKIKAHSDELRFTPCGCGR